VGTGTRIFIHSSKYGDFIEAYDCVSVPNNASEFAINVSNYRHWEEPIRLYVDDCFAGSEGPREKDFNMRWIASLVADCYRILIRGGVFLYPADKRKGYGSGRIRLVYEANPIAFLVEQADGAATDSVNRILDIQPSEPAPAHSSGLRFEIKGGADRPLSRRSGNDQRTLAAVRQPRSFQGLIHHVS
jgi:fructose-1,6-bisphosphatase I